MKEYLKFDIYEIITSIALLDDHFSWTKQTGYPGKHTPIDNGHIKTVSENQRRSQKFKYIMDSTWLRQLGKLCVWIHLYSASFLCVILYWKGETTKWVFLTVDGKRKWNKGNHSHNNFKRTRSQSTLARQRNANVNLHPKKVFLWRCLDLVGLK